MLGQGHLHRQLLVASPLSQSALPPAAGRALTGKFAVAHGNRSRHRQRKEAHRLVLWLALCCVALVVAVVVAVVVFVG